MQDRNGRAIEPNKYYLVRFFNKGRGDGYLSVAKSNRSGPQDSFWSRVWVSVVDVNSEDGTIYENEIEIIRELDLEQLATAGPTETDR
jgi:hypothetical protein